MNIKYLAHAKEGLSNLYFSKLRSLLALLGVLVGTASVVAMVLGGQLATQEALKQFKSLGTDLLAVTVNTAGEDQQGGDGRVDQLSLEQTLSLSQVDQHILQIAPYTQLFQPIFYDGNQINAMTLGVTDDFAKMVNIKLIAGRFVSLLDKYEFFCVIGKEVYEAIKKISYKNPIGQSLQIGKHVFRIVGIADSWAENNFVYANVDNSVLVPVMASMVVSKYATINNIIFRLSPDANITKISSVVSETINQFVSGKQVNFRSAKELIAKMQNQSDILTVFLGLIGSISLLVGGIGVMNIMLVSVVERRREIGIRLAVGAKSHDIGLLFLMEAVMLSLVGGLLGVAMGILIAYLIAVFSHWEFTLFLWPPLVGFSVSVAVGVFSGFYPAFLASKLDPIEALRSA